MPRRAGKGVTLGEVKKRANACAACHAPLGADERIVWTWARQRIHEACMPIWAFADRGRRALGDWIAEPVGLLLARHQGRLCSACLALALSLSLTEARQIVDIVANLPGFRLLPVTCETCGRSTMTLCTVPTAPSAMADTGAPLGKCTHCSRPLEDATSVVITEDGAFHRVCSQVISTRDRIRNTRALTRQSREQLRRAHAMLDRSRTEE